MEDIKKETHVEGKEIDLEALSTTNKSSSSSEVEAEKPQEQQEPQHCQTQAAKEADPNLVTWDGPDDPANPKNWPFSLRWQITAVSSAFTFIAPVSTSMTAPALYVIGEDLNIHASFARSMTLSVFVLAYAFGPFIIGPLSEMYGRRYVLQLFNLLYLAFNTGCGFCKTGPQLIVCRFFAGLGGSTSTVIGAGILGDIWRPEERGKSVGLYTLITLLGPTLGPVLGGFITQYSSWHWTFWSISIADAVIQFVALFVFRETFAPVLLGKKAERLRKETGNQALHTKWERPDRTFSKLVMAGFVRPFILLGTQPILQVLALYISYLFGLMYLALTTFPTLWTVYYGESISIGGLNYLALAIGYILGTQTCTRLIDILYRYLKRTRGNGTGYPEYRLPLLVPGALLVPIGLLWYGWSVERHLHWIMPDIGIAIFGFGIKYGMQCTQLYALDIYPTYAASASAGSMFLRSLAGFGFPLFAPYLYDRLHTGWGNSLLALIALVIGLPAPFMLWIYGPALRKRSQYAVG